MRASRQIRTASDDRMRERSETRGARQNRMAAWGAADLSRYTQRRAPALPRTVRTVRADVLTAAFTRNLERFVRKPPTPIRGLGGTPRVGLNCTYVFTAKAYDAIGTVGVSKHTHDPGRCRHGPGPHQPPGSASVMALRSINGSPTRGRAT